MFLSKPCITLSDLSYKFLDGIVLFEALRCNLEGRRYGLIGDNGSGKTTLLKIIAGELRPTSGGVTTNGRLALMRQKPRYSKDHLIADSFGLGSALSVMKKAETGLATVEELTNMDWEVEGRALKALRSTGLGHLTLSDKVSTLSGGQKTRLEFAVIQYLEPEILLLDEPTNNLDRDGRGFVVSFLQNFSGLSLTISHDRSLLNSLDVIMELSALSLRAYGGNWDFYRSQKAAEIESAAQALKSAKSTLAQADRQAQKVKERQDRRDAAGRQKNKRKVNAKVLMNAQAERAENSSGTSRSLMAQRQSTAKNQVDVAASKIARTSPLKIELPSTILPISREVLNLTDIAIGYDNGPALKNGISFSIIGPERLAITGANGTGKSTLLNTIVSNVPPLSGTVRVTDRLAFLDQEVACLQDNETLLEAFLRLNTALTENDAYSALARFKFRNSAAHKRVSSLSGGEILRAGLACVLCSKHPPELLILDEPTNHLDIASIETVEAALLGFDGALIIVSHDDLFLKRLKLSRKIEL